MNPPIDKVINHKNHNGLHNYRSNLEVCSQSYNRIKAKWPGENRGILLRGKKYKMYMVRIGKAYLGRFKTLEEARLARDTYLGGLDGS